MTSSPCPSDPRFNTPLRSFGTALCRVRQNVLISLPVTSRRSLRVPSGITTATQGVFGETTWACQTASRTPPEVRLISCLSLVRVGGWHIYVDGAAVYHTGAV